MLTFTLTMTVKSTLLVYTFSEPFFLTTNSYRIFGYNDKKARLIGI